MRHPWGWPIWTLPSLVLASVVSEHEDMKRSLWKGWKCKENYSAMSAKKSEGKISMEK
jgi:hypothetical protein